MTDQSGFHSFWRQEDAVRRTSDIVSDNVCNTILHTDSKRHGSLWVTGDKDMGNKIEFVKICKALGSGAYLYDRDGNTLWHAKTGSDGTGSRNGTTLYAEVTDESEVVARIRSGVPLPVAKDGKAEQLTGDWGAYGDGRQPYHGMTADERLLRLCQMAAGRPDRWVLFDNDGAPMHW